MAETLITTDPISSSTGDPARIVEICRWLEDPHEQATVAELASRVGWSPRHLRRVFKDVVGVTPSAYGRAHRTKLARQALRNGSSVTTAAFEAGFGSLRAFYDHGASKLGVAPALYRQGAPGEQLVCGSTGTVLGEIGVAVTRRGVCAVRMGDDRETVLAEIAAEFPAAVVDIDDQGLAPLLEVVAALAAGEPAGDRRIPLDVRGTAFQVEVWEALGSIEHGTVLTYTDVAARIGRPAAHRAVANACGANPVPLILPCHRVVRSDGGHGGYRWGVERKAALLDSEAAIAPR